MGFIMTGQAFFAVLQYNELFSFSWDTYFFPVKQNKQKITRIAKVALNKCPGKSSLNVNHVFLAVQFVLFGLSVPSVM